MQDDTIVSHVTMVPVRPPVLRPYVHFDVPPSHPPADIHHGVLKVRARLVAGPPRIENTHGHTINRQHTPAPVYSLLP